MAKNKGIRFPEELREIIEKMAVSDSRNFSEEVIHLCKLGMDVDKIQKNIYEKAKEEAAINSASQKGEGTKSAI